MMIRDKVRRTESERAPQNMPIENELKVKRVYQVEPIDPVSWAYMRALRRLGMTKRVYSVNPYVEVYQLTENVYGLLTENVDGMGDPWMYLIIGPQKAMLIDTGFGIGNLKGLCDELTGGLELIVVNTHGHPDHSGGNAQFGKIYCHELDVPLQKEQNSAMWNYLFENGIRGSRCIWSEFDEADIIRFEPFEIIGCQDGYGFDLGNGYEIELIHLGGHTPGSCAFLDKCGKGLYMGDNLISMRVAIGPEDGALLILKEGLKRLAGRKNEFSYVFPGHFATAMENSCVDKMLEACCKICNDPMENSTLRTEGDHGVKLCRTISGLGDIVYSENNVKDNV